MKPNVIHFVTRRKASPHNTISTAIFPLKSDCGLFFSSYIRVRHTKDISKVTCKNCLRTYGVK